MDVNLQESLALRRRLHAKETIDILHEFFKCRIGAPLRNGGSDTSNDLVETFLTWANCNLMSCNPKKCKELVKKKKGNSTFYPVVRNTPQHATLDLLGFTFQNDCKFFAHIKPKLCKAKKCLHVLRVCKKSATARQKLIISSIVFFSLT